MATDRSIARYRAVYAALLRLYPAGFRRRFAPGMEQTFVDLCRDRQATGRALSVFVAGLFAETCLAILHERLDPLMPPRKNLVRLLIVVALVLSVPLVAMQFSDDVAWSGFDFVGAFVMLFGTGFGLEVVAMRMVRTAHRFAAGLAFGAALLLIWLNLAVGLIGSEDNPANALYLGVLCVAILGVAIARLRPRPMARALYATAAAQALVPVAALLIWRPLESGAAGIVGVFFLNTFFVVLFLASGILFGAAGGSEAESR